MVHSTKSSAGSQIAKAHSDWYTFLRSAFITGLKAYGASLMVIASPDTTETQISITALTPATHNHPVAKPQPKPAIHMPALPHCPIAKPAWRNA
jgi:hypothetical protein